MCFVVDACKYYAGRSPRKFVAIAHPFAIGIVIVCTIFLVLTETLYVVPTMFGSESMACKIYWMIAFFISYNIFANLLAVYCTDSSVDGLTQEQRSPKPEEASLWHHCDLCQMLVPPRSWHCKLCRCCILRRDHHCIFTATCIGLKNQRYFFWYTFYMTLGTAIALGTNYVFVFTANNSLVFIQLRFMLELFMEIDIRLDWDHWNIWMDLVVLINVFAFVAPVIMFGYQVLLIAANSTYHKSCDSTYNLGLLENFRITLGKRWYWTFLSPVIESPLPLDGTHWNSKILATKLL